MRIARPSHLPITTSLRRTGRASMDSSKPLSTSLEMRGPATTAALSASTPLYMKVIAIRSCEVTCCTAAWSSGRPLGPVTVVIF
jgi:hypothetical protein